LFTLSEQEVAAGNPMKLQVSPLKNFFFFYPLRFLAIVAGTTAFLTAFASAQDLDLRYQPISPLRSAGDVHFPEETPQSGGSPDILLPELRGVIFVDRQEMVTSPAPDIRGISIQGQTLGLLRNGSFNQVVSPYLNHPVSIASLNSLARDVIYYYKNAGRPVVDVNVPEQDITNGVVFIIVTEAKIGRVIVEGAQYFNPNVLARSINLYRGQPITEYGMLEELRWLNESAFRRVNIDMRPGQNFGETDIAFQVKDRFPWQFYAGYDDTGTRATGLERLSVGAVWGNAFNRAHTLSYQLTAAPDFKSVVSHSAVYVIPRANKDRLVLYGSYATTQPYIPPFQHDGFFTEVGFLYDKKLQTHYFDNQSRYEHRLHAGFQFKELNNTLDFGGYYFTTSSRPADIAQIELGYNAQLYDDCGYWALGANLYMSPGKFSKGNSDNIFAAYRPGAESQYMYARIRLERYRDLFCKKFRLYLKGEGQAANKNLFTTEQFGMGGTNSVRGYDSYQLNFDNALLFTAELQTAPTTLGLSRCFRTRETDQFQALVFYDHGMGWNNHRMASWDYKSDSISSVGIGFRYSLNPYFNIKADYGWQLQTDVPNNRGSGRPHLSMTFSY
jgi:hemolysin activation/secretion protein